MKLKTLPLALAALLFSGVSVSAFAADEATKPSADQGTSMPQPDTAKADQGAQAAKPAGNDAAATMRGLDTDGNGLISKEEAGKMKGLSDGFDVADKDKDGTLDADEFTAAVSQIKK